MLIAAHSRIEKRQIVPNVLNVCRMFGVGIFCMGESLMITVTVLRRCKSARNVCLSHKIILGSTGP